MGKKHREKRIKYVQHLMDLEVKREEFIANSRNREKRQRERESDEANVDVNIVPTTTTTVDEKGNTVTKITGSTVVEVPKLIEAGADADGRQLKRSRPERKK